MGKRQWEPFSHQAEAGRGGGGDRLFQQGDAKVYSVCLRHTVMLMRPIASLRKDARTAQRDGEGVTARGRDHHHVHHAAAEWSVVAYPQGRGGNCQGASIFTDRVCMAAPQHGRLPGNPLIEVLRGSN